MQNNLELLWYCVKTREGGRGGGKGETTSVEFTNKICLALQGQTNTLAFAKTRIMSERVQCNMTSQDNSSAAYRAYVLLVA